MNSFIKLLFLCSMVYLTLKPTTAQSTSTLRVSDDQLNMALNDKRYLKRQLKCVLEEANCDPVGRRLKSLVPLVMRNTCPQCTPEELRQIRMVISHIQRTFPKEWAKLVKQYAGV